MQLKKISIGSAQFGQRYGITNKRYLKNSEIKEILLYAKTKGINFLDTAFIYGNAESRLGKIGIKNWIVSSKIPKIPENTNEKNWIEKKLRISLKRLKIKNLETLFLHHVDQTRGYFSNKKIFNCMDRLKEEGLINNIGISVYNIENNKRLLQDFNIDSIQAPGNVFDYRIFKKKNQELLQKFRIKLEIRSIFLQGLILENPGNIPIKFRKYQIYFKKLHDLSKKYNSSPIKLALSFLKTKKYHKLIIGVKSKDELREIILENKKKKNLKLPKFNIKNRQYLINPYLW
ncbi:aldo/keto reductase [Candidatus Pelagibacter sp.]|nr:aldo/keto reductase [Candidatus Pelagibacter sp.]MDC1049423.1 aldo/keto reductase [Candidatus Pelagibacter sp.]